MGLIGGVVGDALLKAIAPPADTYLSDKEAKSARDGDAAALREAFGDDIGEQVRGRTVIDFGCGPGREAVQLVRLGARRVIGVDIQDVSLEQARAHARSAGIGEDECSFVRSTDEHADLVLSRDAFEHFEDPAAILRCMHGLLKPGGRVLASFGPTWLHPYGGHYFSMFPWAHLLFSERALIRWRARYKDDGATGFASVAGGLNQLTIRGFEAIVACSPLRFESLETVPIRGIGALRTRALREFGSSLVRCSLIARDQA